VLYIIVLIIFGDLAMAPKFFGDQAMAPNMVIMVFGVRHRSYALLPTRRSFLMMEVGRRFRNAALDSYHHRFEPHVVQTNSDEDGEDELVHCRPAGTKKTCG